MHKNRACHVWLQLIYRSHAHIENSMFANTGLGHASHVDMSDGRTRVSTSIHTYTQTHMHVGVSPGNVQFIAHQSADCTNTFGCIYLYLAPASRDGHVATLTIYVVGVASSLSCIMWTSSFLLLFFLLSVLRHVHMYATK